MMTVFFLRLLVERGGTAFQAACAKPVSDGASAVRRHLGKPVMLCLSHAPFNQLFGGELPCHFRFQAAVGGKGFRLPVPTTRPESPVLPKSAAVHRAGLPQLSPPPNLPPAAVDTRAASPAH